MKLCAVVGGNPLVALCVLVGIPPEDLMNTNISCGSAAGPSVLAVTLLSVMADCEDATRYALEHLRLGRIPHDETDRLDLALFTDLSPLLARFPGDRTELWRQHPPRWRQVVMDALVRHDTHHREEGPFKLLVARWVHRGGTGWRHPAEGIAAASSVPALPWGAIARWTREVRIHPSVCEDRLHPLRRLANIERIAMRNRQCGDHGGVLACWDHYRRCVSWLAHAHSAAA